MVKDCVFRALPASKAKDAQRRLDMKQKFADGSISDACAQFIDLADGTADWFNGPKRELRPLGTYRGIMALIKCLPSLHVYT